MSEPMNTILEMTSSPMVVKNPWSELKSPFRELIVAGSRLMAARADRRRAFARPHAHVDTLVVPTEPGAMINKSPEMMAAIQNRDEFHGAKTGGGNNRHHKP